MFANAGYEDAANRVYCFEDMSLRERILSAAKRASSLNTEAYVEAVFPESRIDLNDPVHRVLYSVIDREIDQLSDEGSLMCTWESSMQVPSYELPEKVWALMALGLMVEAPIHSQDPNDRRTVLMWDDSAFLGDRWGPGTYYYPGIIEAGKKRRLKHFEEGSPAWLTLVNS
jgi:hypothetical protein